MNAEQQKRILESADGILEDFQKRTAELHDVMVPTWNARADTLKTIASLSSASIVLSVTFSSSLRQVNAGSAWRYLIVFSFALFVLALITAFWSLWYGSGVYQMQSSMLNKRQAMRDALMGAASAEEVEKSLLKVLTDALQPIYTTDRRVTTLYTISGLCFCVAVISLAVVGAVRLF